MKQYVKLYQSLKSGKMVSVTEIAKTLGKDIKMNRLSTYIWELKALGGKFEVDRDGKKVVGYKLTNAGAIADKVNAASTRANAAKPKVAKPAKVKAIKAKKPAKAKAEAKDEEKETVASAPKHQPKAPARAMPDLSALKSEFGVGETQTQ